MATMFRVQLNKRAFYQASNFDATTQLESHAWHPEMTVIEAEAALANKPSYTYLTRLREGERGFTISFVNLQGAVEHHHFTLVDPKYGIWRNGSPHHIGSLGKVICDMMRCTILDCKPLN